MHPAFAYSYGLVLSHVVVDEIWGASEARPLEVLGGAGTHAAAGQALAYESTGSSVLISGVGADFPAEARRELNEAGIDDLGLVAVHQSTPRTVIRYTTETERTERPAFGMEHFKRCDPQLSMVPAARRNPEAVYIFAGVDEPAWEVIEQLPRSKSVVWELDVAVCDPTFADDIRSRAKLVDLVSLNEQELDGLVGGSSLSHLRIAMLDLFPGAAAVALRRGAQGAVLATAENVWSAHPGSERHVVDPTGAGNAFSGALAVAWRRTRGDPAQTLAASMAAAAITVAHDGPALPLDDHVRANFSALKEGQQVHKLVWNEQEQP